MTNLDADHRGIRLVGTNKTYSEKTMSVNTVIKKNLHYHEKCARPLRCNKFSLPPSKLSFSETRLNCFRNFPALPSLPTCRIFHYHAVKFTINST